MHRRRRDVFVECARRTVLVDNLPLDTLERCSFHAMHDFQPDSPTGMSWHFASNRVALDMAPRHFSWTVQLKCLGTLPSTAECLITFVHFA